MLLQYIPWKKNLSAENKEHLPNALDHFKEIAIQMHKKQPLLVLDYDGTLTSIVDRPELAVLSDETKSLLGKLSQKMTVAIISGRDRPDVEKLVDVEGILYAGSHGFDMAGLGSVHAELEEVKRFERELSEAGCELDAGLQHIKGALVERKKYGVAAHYRQVSEKDLEQFMDVINKVHRRHIQLRKMCGKKVIEFQPDIDWNKGKALLWVLKCLHFNSKTMITLYIGDDRTDEDAFEVLKNEGIGIRVEEEETDTHASYILKNPAEVVRFLNILNEF